MTIKLSQKALPELSGSIRQPSYNRKSLKAGILHFGLGNFHRAHQAVYLDELFNADKDHEWAIIGAGVFEFERPNRQKLMEQDWLTTVVERDADSQSAHITGSMIDFIEPGDVAALIDCLADPAIRIVSLTITEGGYFIDPATQTFNASHPEITADAANPAVPKTVFGIILAGLKKRRDEGVPAFTIMSCDNIPHNGLVTKKALIGLAQLSDPEFAKWIADNVAFPNSMVDRITPVTTDQERTFLTEIYGLEDNWPVFCEPYRQWVLEDHFPSGRPALETVGVEFVEDVGPFELMKIRILNGGHATIAYPAALLDIHYVHQAMEHPLIHSYLAKLERDEIIPTVPPVPNTNLLEYFALVEKRFANPTIGDTISRLCHDGSNRQPKFIIPTIGDRLASGHSIEGLALETALWCRYCSGTTDSGKLIKPNDPIWERLTETAKRAKSSPEAWLNMADIYGDIGQSAIFGKAFANALNSLWQAGTAATLHHYIHG